MRRSAPLVVGIAIVAGVALAAEPPLRPSRPPDPGCTWRPLGDRRTGIRLLVADCTGKDRYVLSFRGNVLEQHLPAHDRTFNGPYVLEVFAKPPDQDIRDAIRHRFVDPLPPAARDGCEVRVERESMLAGSNAIRLTIVPTDAYGKRVEDEARRREEVPDAACGEHGERQMETYFEYHPSESRTTYAHVVYGWGSEKPLFDEGSIVFLPTSIPPAALHPAARRSIACARAVAASRSFDVSKLDWAIEGPFDYATHVRRHPLDAGGEGAARFLANRSLFFVSFDPPLTPGRLIFGGGALAWVDATTCEVLGFAETK